MTITIRPEQPADSAAIFDLTRLAFATAAHSAAPSSSSSAPCEIAAGSAFPWWRRRVGAFSATWPFRR